nr:MAG TPA: hypothetical protein [Caudoviricetes sp.]
MGPFPAASAALVIDGAAPTETFCRTFGICCPARPKISAEHFHQQILGLDLSSAHQPKATERIEIEQGNIPRQTQDADEDGTPDD